MKKIQEYVNKINRVKEPKFVDWLLVGLIIVFCYFSFNHADILCTASHGRDLVYCILQGKFMEFYDFTQSTAVYCITVYILFAIWSLPIMVIYKVIGIEMWAVLDFMSIPYPVLMWYKLLPTLFYFAIAFLLYKIVMEIKHDANIAKWISFLFISSPIAIFSQFIFGQYDSLGLFLAVWAFYMFIKKKYYSFSILCSLAITFKLFAIFLFIPLILLIEKRVFHIIKYGLISISGYLITTAMFLGSQGYRNAISFSGDIAPRLFEVGIATTMGTISLFTVAIMLICIWAYVKNITNNDEFFNYSIYISFAVFGTLFAFILWHPQWVIFLIPFMTLAFMLNNNYNSSLILHSAMAVGYLGIVPMAFPGNVDACMLQFGILPKIFGNRAIGNITDLIQRTGAETNICYSFFAGAILVLLVYCFPNNKPKSIPVSDAEQVTFGDRLFVLARPITLILFIVPALYVFMR